MKYKALVLDHDDTFVQTEKTIGYPYFRDYIEKIRPGHTLSYAQYVRDCNNMIFSDMCKEQWKFTPQEEQEEYLGWKAYSLQHIPPLCDGMDTLLKRYKEAGGLIFVSSLSTKQIIQRDYLHHLGFLPDAIYDYELPPHLRKPNQYALDDIMQRYQLSAHQLLMVDDMELGYRMASQAGVETAFAGWSKVDFPELTVHMRNVCKFCFHSPRELEEFLFG